MKMFGKLLIGLVLILFFGCSNEDYEKSIVEDCSEIENVKILSAEEGCCGVFGASVYVYKNELYRVQGFCSCDEFFLSMTANPINCDGLKLCDVEGINNIQNCISELKFYENAEFLFTIIYE